MTVEACTFTPLCRNRFRCNHPNCKKPNGGPVIVKRAQLGNHRTSKYNERNPRRPLPPSARLSNADRMIKLDKPVDCPCCYRTYSHAPVDGRIFCPCGVNLDTFNMRANWSW